MHFCLHFIVVVFSASLLPESKATTDKLDVIALNSLFKDLNSASRLKGWKLDGGDPCGDVWTGVACYGSSVTHLTIPQLNLGGYLGQLDNLHNLRHLDVSSNNIEGEIPYGLPPNVTHVNMACNRFIKNIPHSLSFLTNLRHLNLSHNLLSGPIGDVFTRLQSLKTMDLSNNKFTGDLPKSFGSLTNLTELFLENNNFTGSVVYLAELPLITCIKRSNAKKLESLDSSVSTHHSHIISPSIDFSTAAQTASPPFANISSAFNLASRRNPTVLLTNTENTARRKSSFAGELKFSTNPKEYTVAELQLATNSFSEENLLGEGSLGPVYKAEFPDGQKYRSFLFKAFAVKVINMASLSFDEEEKFMDVIQMASQLRHPNIVRLIGYCVEHDQHVVVYEYVRNLSLEDALHNEVFKPLSWGLRLGIALGIARALDYLHSAFHPPASHSNIKAANILLDEKLTPRVCDCGLSVLRPLTSNSAKTKVRTSRNHLVGFMDTASEIAIMNTGYIAPEHGQPGNDNTKSDVYAFGVLLLELLTARRPLDSSKPRDEQSLVEWASFRLHDSESLQQMVDPGIRRTFPARFLSGFADIVSLCIQPEKEFRPCMSEIVEALALLSQKMGTTKSNTAVGGTEVEPLLDRSFRSTQTCFVGSPTASLAIDGT
ncbi:Protein STRUBBELIG-RECEPTOR FAMILY 2 [Hibiscus syriacus]|uniref:Protein STRUBBELIG-RECEPTOR FAMILY 2 n=1 Tax=Hibiscus syriacus TaxID=106335 RepID=A0A6A2YML6_HIBSY|nr:Protein STRUBBELIG-RECEPTOR FAMILY 2 [Hibiscus syriacus]